MRKIINLERYIKHKTTREWVEALLFALIVASVFRTFLYSPFKVPTGSMIHTIEIGDQLFADMHAYGFFLPYTGTFTVNETYFEDLKRDNLDQEIIDMVKPLKGETYFLKSSLEGDLIEKLGERLFEAYKEVLLKYAFFPDIRFFSSKVQREDIIIFPFPEDTSIDFIKRAVAVGGDTVEFIGEDVYINGKKENKGYVFQNPSAIPLPLYTKFTVPEGKVFAMGDNRRNSKDSRFWGFVDERMIRGKGFIIYWSHDSNKSLLEGYKIERIGTILR